MVVMLLFLNLDDKELMNNSLRTNASILIKFNRICIKVILDRVPSGTNLRVPLVGQPSVAVAFRVYIPLKGTLQRLTRLSIQLV